MNNKVGTGYIWEDPNQEFPMGEAMSPTNSEPHYKMSKLIADIISHDISDDYESQRLLSKMIRNRINEQMGEMLREYDNIVAEDILRSFKNELRLDWDNAGNEANNGVKFNTKHPDYDHARHAKLSSFARELKEKIVMLKKSE